MDLDYISTRRLSRFYDNLKDWLSLNYSTKVELAEATQDMRGATEQFAGAHGLVPTPAAADRNKFLKGDGTWATPPAVTPTPRQIGALAARDTYVNGGTIYSLVISAPDKPASIFTYTDEGSRQLNYWGVPYNGTTTGQVLTYNSSSGPYWAMPADPLPTLSVDNSLLLGQSDGSKTWTALERDTFGSITDDEDDDIQDEEGNSIGDENSVELWTSFNGTGFGAERAVADADGNNIAETYAKKGEASSVTTSYDAQTKTLTINI